MKDVVESTDGIAIHFEVEGQGPPALVFVHGWSCDRTYWSDQVGHFARRLQVVTVDLAGHGESGLGRLDWTMAAFGEDVAAVANELDLDRMVLIGHSMGGDVIVEAALRMAGRVAGLVWVDVYRSLGSPRFSEQHTEMMKPFRRDFIASTQHFVRTMFPADADQSLIERVANDMSSAPPEIAIGAISHSLSNDGPILEGLRRLTAPVVAINSDNWPTDVESLGEFGVKVVLMPGVGHFLMMEAPAEFNRLLADVIAEF